MGRPIRLLKNNNKVGQFLQDMGLDFRVQILALPPGPQAGSSRDLQWVASDVSLAP